MSMISGMLINGLTDVNSEHIMRCQYLKVPAAIPWHLQLAHHQGPEGCVEQVVAPVGFNSIENPLICLDWRGKLAGRDA